MFYDDHADRDFNSLKRSAARTEEILKGLHEVPIITRADGPRRDTKAVLEERKMDHGNSSADCFYILCGLLSRAFESRRGHTPNSGT